MVGLSLYRTENAKFQDKRRRVEMKGAKSGEILLLKVTLRWYRGTSKSPYRVLAVPGNLTLYRLAKAILDSFDFDFDHAFGFYNNIKNWTKSDIKYELNPDGDAKSVKRTRVEKVFNRMKKKMLFLYDYGDEWHFIVKLVGRESPKKGIKYPVVVESVGEAPDQYGYWEDEE